MNFNVMDAAGTAATGGWGSMLIMLVVYGGLIAAMYFIFFRPQSKKNETESVIIETGSDRARLRVKRWAIGSVDTIHEEDA